MTDTPQGLIAPAILVPATALDEANISWLLDEVSNFAIWAENDAMLVPGEYPAEAQWANAYLHYIGQVENGGHGQFAANSDLRPGTMAGIDKALGAAKYGQLHDIFRDFLAQMDVTEIKQHALQTAGFDGTPESLKALDRRYFALGSGDAKVERLSDWAASLPMLKPVPKERLEAERAAIIAANRSWQARRDKRTVVTAALEANDPRRVAASALCEAVGERFERFTGGNPLPGGAIVWVFESSAGMGAMVIGGDKVDGQDKALLLDANFKPRDVYCAWPFEAGGRVIVSRPRTGLSKTINRITAWFRRRR